MSDLPDSLPTAFARRLAERDNPPPPPPLSMEPAAVQARIEAWLRTTGHLRDTRSLLRMGRMVRALMQHPERTTAQLAEAAGLPARAAARVAVRLNGFAITTWEYRGLYRFHRLTRAAEDALLLVVMGPPPAPSPQASQSPAGEQA
ncbi:hypothetical protein [Hymenobacter negativus]|uniref:MarR family transcriptional regulator n=1 Tax=Hymenobacter negativus TaxID=2795026 RepID=A0ABS3QCR0_9BACT|nr:hypothetical protein [Hymenobacter negativus]MBO2009026.1 hypothetical protein [Hymenobacter negativus]